MLYKFYDDLTKAKKAEQLVREVFTALTDKYTFDDVSEVRECRYKGDIKATAADGKEIYIEVKDDSRIADTGNVLCEYKNYIKDTEQFIKGNMLSDYDIYTIVSQAERKIYVIDFDVLKRIYKKGEFKVIPHQEQDTYCYLLALSIVKKYGGLIEIIEY